MPETTGFVTGVSDDRIVRVTITVDLNKIGNAHPDFLEQICKMLMLEAAQMLENLITQIIKLYDKEK